MTMTTTLRPGILVSFSTSMVGNRHYDKRTIERAKRTGDAESEKWETTRRVDDVNELERAQEALSKIGSTVRRICAKSYFGLLCPESQEAELDAAIAEAERIRDEFNSSASITRLHIYLMKGRIASDDVEAVKKISSEVRDLMDDMEQGLKNLDVKLVREAASRATNMGQMLSEEAADRVAIAVDIARKAAREIVKAGDQGAFEIDSAAIRKIKQQRTAFLDMDDALPMQKPTARTKRVDMDAR